MSAGVPRLSVAAWREHNDDYLTASLAWLRLLLARGAGSGEPGERTERDERRLGRARERVLSLERSVPPPALVLLSAALGLTRFEQDVVLLCAAMELDTRTGELCAAAMGDPHQPYPCFALAMTIFDEPEWSALSPSGALRAWRLVEVSPAVEAPLVLRPLRVDERIAHFVKGLNVLDERLAVLLHPVESAAGPLPPSQQAAADAMKAATGLLQLVGNSPASTRALAGAVCAELGLHLYELPLGALPAGAAEARELAALWARESRLLPVALLVTGAEEPTQGQVLALRRLAERAAGPLFVGLADVCAELADLSSAYEIRNPTPAEQRDLWQSALRTDPAEDVPGQRAHPDLAGRMAAEFDLDAGRIARLAAGGAAGVRARCRALSRPRLDALAQRLTPAVTWDDLVLAAEPARQLRELADQARHRRQVYDDWGWRGHTARGLGISALFAGESGTGKTMAAEVLAADLELDLYRVDLSGVVSKYIGETEKNLRRLFDAAEQGGVLLLFDEADALFGKRTEVRDSHDRYANIEVNYLLQRMETYRGLAVLATNLRAALDPAFTRRLRFIVPFALPAAAERERIWAGAFPGGVPMEGLDVPLLARLNLSGALIHAIALHASFSAAAAGTPVTMPLVLAAARRELRKADRPTNEVESL
ncbi:ATP-binding protein [Acrocarpospora macrocephala]|uniref:ATPase n=1 Tax=Acrocarpospora macrocephala TaxID=150177 RepID=A0A5M3WUQ9_9ACTN|nr:ATP-binding protein [Acrocarpospora macrocephala]GES11932.1 ATPase [Acrocarpospora macrocephala]